MNDFDYVIVGSGPAGCVLANRLSADPATRVALIEAGPESRHPFITMPKGFGRLLTGSRFITHYRTEPDAAGQRHVWARGATLGGSTAINGMAYSRGQPEDYDAWEAAGAAGWGWREMAAGFRAIEDHELGADEERGSGGPLHVGINRTRHPANEAVLAAARHIGLPVREDVNRADQQGIGPMPHMIRRGRRVSAVDAFLAPVRYRANLTVMTDTLALRVLFEGRRASAVLCRRDGVETAITAQREVILSAGAFETPKLLMLSGVGPSAQLHEHGIAVLHDSPGVGRNLAEHRGIALQFALNRSISHNPHFSGARLLLHALRYYLTRGGMMAYGSHELMGFARVLATSTNADTQFFISPFSRVPGAPMTFERRPGMQCLIYPGRPTSRGSLTLASTDPAMPPSIDPPGVVTERDRAVAVAMVAWVRRLFATRPLADLVTRETLPGPDVTTEEAILAAIAGRGTWGYHTCGTARMGTDAEAVVDPALRLHGLENIRVIDASVFPGLVSANTTAPVAALAWLAADRMLAGGSRQA
ncbi:MAG: FAD-binding protein [Bradyrhizobium sp.]|nr:FAD-binding protein [Bradyrhizobium sp.]